MRRIIIWTCILSYSIAKGKVRQSILAAHIHLQVVVLVDYGTAPAAVEVSGQVCIQQGCHSTAVLVSTTSVLVGIRGNVVGAVSVATLQGYTLLRLADASTFIQQGLCLVDYALQSFSSSSQVCILGSVIGIQQNRVLRGKGFVGCGQFGRCGIRVCQADSGIAQGIGSGYVLCICYGGVAAVAGKEFTAGSRQAQFSQAEPMVAVQRTVRHGIVLGGVFHGQTNVSIGTAGCANNGRGIGLRARNAGQRIVCIVLAECGNLREVGHVAIPVHRISYIDIDGSRCIQIAG